MAPHDQGKHARMTLAIPLQSPGPSTRLDYRSVGQPSNDCPVGCLSPAPLLPTLHECPAILQPLWGFQHSVRCRVRLGALGDKPLQRQDQAKVARPKPLASPEV